MVTRPKRPKDVIALSKLIGDIATGQATETFEEEKNPAAVALGRLGGMARAEKLTREQLSGIGKIGVQARKKKATAPPAQATVAVLSPPRKKHRPVL